MRKRNRVWGVSFGLVLVLLTPGVAQATSTFRTRFEEKSGPSSSNLARGVHAVFAWDAWYNSNGDAVACPSGTYTTNEVDTLIHGKNSSGYGLEFGVYSAVSSNGCVNSNGIYYSITDSFGPGGNSWSATPAVGTRNWAINRLPGGSSGCLSSATYCWFLRISDTASPPNLLFEKDVAADDGLPGFDAFVNASLECVMNTASQCNSTVKTSGAPRDVSNLTWKDSSNTWLAWAGQDQGCADHSANADGKWITDDEVKMGMNSTMSGSLTNNCA